MNELKEQIDDIIPMEWYIREDNTYTIVRYDREEMIDDLIQLIETYTTRKELEAKEQELEVLKRLDLEFNVIICGCGEPYKDTDPHYIVKERITQLSTELTNKEMK